MRNTAIMTAALIAALIVLIGAARGIGQRDAGDPFPLPDTDGCWMGLCFAGMRGTQIQSAVWNHPGLGFQNTLPSPMNYRVILEQHDPPLAVVLHTFGDGYALSWDWGVPDNPPLMRIGALVETLGPPDHLSGTQNGVTLHYPARSLNVTVYPDRIGLDWAYLPPDLPVYALIVFPPDVFEATADWHGFGWYEFAY